MSIADTIKVEGDYKTIQIGMWNGAPLVWYILKEDGGKVLVITEKTLGLTKYHSARADVTWESCDLRNSLNGGFIETAFTESEKKQIAWTLNENPNNNDFGTYGGNPTFDRVFCLSSDEAKLLLKTRYRSVCCMIEEELYCIPWWLRTPGSSNSTASVIDSCGDVFSVGCFVDCYGQDTLSLCDKNSASGLISCVAVRPAMWINLFNEDEERENLYGTSEREIKLGRWRGGVLTWRIIKEEEDRILLLSTEAIEAKAYHCCWADVTWETCDLRNFLNGEFLETAFSESEKKRIVWTDVQNSDNSRAKGGNDTLDRVFCLSIDEAESLLRYSWDRTCSVSSYLKNDERVNIDVDSNMCFWWLRSPGYGNSRASYIDSNGNINKIGYSVDERSLVVRPAIWVNR